VKSFSKIFLVCAFLAAIFLANVNAQPSSQTNAGSPPVISNPADSTAVAQTAQPAAEEVLPTEAAPALFYIGPSPDKNVPSIFTGWWPAQIALPISNSIVCSWIVAAVILVMVRSTTSKRIKEIPSGMQNFLEMLVEGWEAKHHPLDLPDAAALAAFLPRPR